MIFKFRSLFVNSLSPIENCLLVRFLEFYNMYFMLEKYIPFFA